MARINPLSFVTRASFLLVLIGVLIFLFAFTAQDSVVFPSNAIKWHALYTIYLVTFSLILILGLVITPSIITRLATANYWKASLTRFLPKALFYTFLLLVLQSFLKGQTSISILSFISNIPLPVILTHAFVVAQIEEIGFAGVIHKAIEQKSNRTTAQIWTTALFVFWHFAKTNGNWIVLLTYVPLRIWWDYERDHGTPLLNKMVPGLFGPSPETQQGNSGSHFAWNLFVLGVTP